MSIKAVLFDLDGTLLPMDQDLFIKKYLTYISGCLAQRGYEPKELAKNIMRGTYAMIKNDGTRTNEQVFWEFFKGVYGDKAIADMEYFDRFYVEHFDELCTFTSKNPLAAHAVKWAHELGFRTILATNPVFPEIAVHKRMSWAGVNTADFELCTTYENSHYCKPNPEYYAEIAQKAEIDVSECLMVGNDTSDDMSAALLRMDVFLLTDCLINTSEVDICKYPHGDFTALEKYMEERA